MREAMWRGWCWFADRHSGFTRGNRVDAERSCGAVGGGLHSRAAVKSGGMPSPEWDHTCPLWLPVHPASGGDRARSSRPRTERVCFSPSCKMVHPPAVNASASGQQRGVWRWYIGVSAAYICTVLIAGRARGGGVRETLSAPAYGPLFRRLASLRGACVPAAREQNCSLVFLLLHASGESEWVMFCGIACPHDALLAPGPGRSPWVRPSTTPAYF